MIFVLSVQIWFLFSCCCCLLLMCEMRLYCNNEMFNGAVSVKGNRCRYICLFKLLLLFLHVRIVFSEFSLFFCPLFMTKYDEYARARIIDKTHKSKSKFLFSLVLKFRKFVQISLISFLDVNAFTLIKKFW